MTTAANTKPPRIIPLNMVPTVQGYEHWKESILRQLNFYATARYKTNGTAVAANGFDTCIIRLGRRVYINLDTFDEWLLAKQPTKIGK